jgi:hypothetical protein
MNYHQLTLTAMNCHEVPRTTMNYHELPRIAMNHHELPPTMNYHEIPPTTMNCHSLPLTTTNYHELPRTAMNYHQLPWTAMNYHELPPATMNCHKLPPTTNYHELPWTADNHKLHGQTCMSDQTAFHHSIYLASAVTLLTLSVCSPHSYDQCTVPDQTRPVSLLFVQYLKPYFARSFPCVSNLYKRTTDRYNGCLTNDIFWGTTAINTSRIQTKSFTSMFGIRLWCLSWWKTALPRHQQNLCNYCY